MGRARGTDRCLARRVAAERHQADRAGHVVAVLRAPLSSGSNGSGSRCRHSAALRRSPRTARSSPCPWCSLAQRAVDVAVARANSTEDGMGSLVAGVDTSTQATKVLVVDWRRAASSPAVAQGTRSVVNAARARPIRANGGRRSGRRSRRRVAPRTSQPSRSGASSMGWLCSARMANPCARRCSGTTRVPRHRRRRSRKRSAPSGWRTEWAPAGGLVHGNEVGLAARARADDRRRNRSDPVAARLPDRTPHRRGRH